MRRSNWDVGLRAWAGDRIGRPYVWGQTDCLTLAAQALGSMYSAAPEAPRFATRTAALRALAEDPDILRRLPRDLGATPFALPFAQTGDLLIPPPCQGEPALIVCLGGSSLTASIADGVYLLPTLALPRETLAWRWPHG